MRSNSMNKNKKKAQKTRYILSIDGGGIRGLASASAINTIESNFNIKFSKFDMFAGTSAGGLLSAGIAALGFTGQQCMDLFNIQNAELIMNKSFIDKLLNIIQPAAKYDGMGKRLVIDKVFRDIKISKVVPKLLITAYDLKNRSIKVFKNNSDTLLADITDATSAAPCYFPPVKIKNNLYCDGGIVANNPAMCAYAEAKKIWPEDEIKLISIGTGEDSDAIYADKSFGIIDWFDAGLMDIILDGNAIDYQCRTILGDNYIRINGPLLNASNLIDDVEITNLTELIIAGKSWVNDNFTELSKFFR